MYDYHYRTLKDTKRRVLQASVAAVDPSLKTVDLDYDIHVAKFPEVFLHRHNDIHISIHMAVSYDCTLCSVCLCLCR